MTSDGRRAGAIGIAVTWLVAIAGSVAVLVLEAGGGLAGARGDHGLTVYAGLSVVFAIAVLTALLAQLASRRPQGYVVRVSAAVGGAAVVLLLAAVAAVPLLLTA
ncbi:hypothetical protein ACDF64_00560 [Agromyces sp. MMS24-JH15]|uniref:hypothetical protein n=1 Tax=Agromyces sp. MMS24-JH15 TaxID=3243765 RepID=UPI003749094A